MDMIVDLEEEVEQVSLELVMEGELIGELSID